VLMASSLLLSRAPRTIRRSRRAVVGVARSPRRLVPFASIRETELSLMHWDVTSCLLAGESGHLHVIPREDLDAFFPVPFVCCTDSPACPGHGRVRADGGCRSDAGAAVLHAVQPDCEGRGRPGYGLTPLVPLSHTTSRQPAQATVEAALAALLFGLVIAVALQVGFWAYADNITLAAAQEAARAASAQGSDLEHGLAVGKALLQSGLGPSAHVVTLTGREDATSVTVDVRGGWPLGLGTDSHVSLPLDNEVRVLKQIWTP
jgi:hypothetical protein